MLNFKEKFKAKIKLLPQFTITDTRVVNDPDEPGGVLRPTLRFA